MTVVTFAWRDTGDRFQVDLAADELALYEGLRDRALALPAGEERTTTLNELGVFMEMKHALGARLLPVPAPELTEEEAAARDETLALMDDLEERGFAIPARAREEVASGQTSLLDLDPADRLDQERGGVSAPSDLHSAQRY